MESSRAESSPRLVTRAERLPPPSFRAVCSALDRPRTAWDDPDGATIVAGGVAAAVSAEPPGAFEALRTAAADLFAAGDVDAASEIARPRLFGGVAFHDGACAGDPWSEFPEARFVLPRVQVTWDDGTAWLTVSAAGPDATVDAVQRRLAAARAQLSDLPDPGPIAAPPGIERRRRTTDPTAWRESVEATVGRIRAGELRKVVLAQALETDLAGELSVPDLLARLRNTYPDCTSFLFEPDGGASFLGATPERLVTRRGRTVETGALAGTTGRGDTPEEDEWLAGELRDSEKDRHEHDLVVEAIREQLAPYASSLSTGPLSVRRLATVQHLWTPISAELAADNHVLDIVEALHPTPAVGGLPPDRALATIRETEAFDRGWYAAPIGWFDAAGNGSFAVALRSAVVDAHRATLFAGVGVVADSDPDAEWEEVELKFRPVLDELEAD